MSIVDYIRHKLGQHDTLALYVFRAANKLADRNGLYIQWDEDAGEWLFPLGGNRYQGVPKNITFIGHFDASFIGEDAREYARAFSGEMFIHVVNIDVDDIDSFLEGFRRIEGHVCFSSFGDELLVTAKARFAVVVKGTPEFSFPYDCWSRVGTDGRRVPAGLGNQGRHEHWIVPKDAELVAVLKLGEIPTPKSVSVWDISPENIS